MRRQRRLLKRLLMNFLNFFNIANVLNYSVLTNIGLPLKFLYTFITDSSINNFKCSGKKFIKVTEQVSFFPLVIKITSHAFSQHNHHYSLGPPVKARTPVLEEFWQYWALTTAKGLRRACESRWQCSKHVTLAKTEEEREERRALWRSDNKAKL